MTATAKQTELEKARAEVEQLEKESAEMGARIERDHAELGTLRRAQQPQNLGADVDLDELSQSINHATALETRILGDEQRRRELDRQAEFARSRQGALQIEPARLVEDAERYESELGGRGQVARLEREGNDLLNRAQNLRATAENKLQQARIRLTAIGE